MLLPPREITILKINLITRIFTLSVTVTTAKLIDTLRMNSPLLGRNVRQLLMPALALLLINVPVAQAKLNWPEGTKGELAIGALIFASMVFGSGMVGAIVYAYRSVAARRPIPSDEEIISQLRESGQWRSYIAWIRADLPNAHPLEEAAVARIIDLEKQLFGVPPPPRPQFCRLFSYLLPSKLFNRHSRAAKSGSTPTRDDKSTNETRRPDKGKAPERLHISQPQISTESSTTIKDDGKIAITEDGYKNATHDSESFAKSARPSGKSTAHMTKFATTDKTRKSAGQHVIAPLPKAHKAKSSNHSESPTGLAAALAMLPHLQ